MEIGQLPLSQMQYELRQQELNDPLIHAIAQNARRNNLPEHIKLTMLAYYAIKQRDLYKAELLRQAMFETNPRLTVTLTPEQFATIGEKSRTDPQDKTA